MELEEAKEILANIIDDEVIGTYCIEIQKEGVSCNINCESQECYLHLAIETVLQELDRLQKGNEELMNEYHKRVQERIDIEQELKDSISKDKIREKIEEIKARMNDDCLALHEFQRIAKIDVLEELLKEE